MTFAKQQEAWAALTEQRLARLCDAYLPADSEIGAAARYSLLGGGKRVRAVLTLAACQVVGCAPEAALDYACALEMLHCYSLIHDDLPSMDNDDFRRGRPSCHRQFGEATALLAGDALLTAAFDTTSSHVNEELRKIEVNLTQLPRALDQIGVRLQELEGVLKDEEK